MSNLPCGIWLLEKIGCRLSYNSPVRNASFRWLVFVLTFVTYTSYHASRKPISVVKNVLNQNCTGKAVPIDVNSTADPHWCDWQPFGRCIQHGWTAGAPVSLMAQAYSTCQDGCRDNFLDGDNSNTLLGFIDSAYLFSYAFFMFFSGMVAERVDLRYFLTLGMLMSAVFVWAFGVAHTWNIHSLGYFIAVQIACGIFEATGWPGVVTAMGNWHEKSKRGFIFGIWNSHTSVGNILGTLMASAFVDTDWGLSFIVPATFIATVGVMNFLFLTPYPTEVGCDPPPASEPTLLPVPVDAADADADADAAAAAGARSDQPAADSTAKVSANDGGSRDSDLERVLSEVNPTEDRTSRSSQPEVIGFFRAFLIPGVLPFAICLFFAKLVSYTFLYWLPRYLHSAANYSASDSANISTLFDLGGIVGGILAGILNDWTGAPGIVCVVLLIAAIPTMFVYQTIATVSHALNTMMLVLMGLLVNGPYALITTAVSADLGTSLRGNARALATVTAIIDGTGSVGAGLGPLLAGAVSSGDDWTGVFIMLMCSDAVAALSLGRVVLHEVRAIRRRRRERRERLVDC